jgi:Tfp pilus assembly protein PilF
MNKSILSLFICGTFGAGIAALMVSPMLLKAPAPSKRIVDTPETRARQAEKKALRGAAWAAERDGDYAKAERIYKELLDKNFANAITYMDMAHMFERAGERRKALDAYDRVINPPEAYRGSSMETDSMILGRYLDLCLEFNEMDKARIALERLVNLGKGSIGGQSTPSINRNPASDPELMAAARVVVGLGYALKGRYGEAKENYRKAIEADPNSAVAHYYLAYEQERDRDWRGAQQRYKRALALGQRDAVLKQAAGKKIADMDLMIR